MKTMDALLNATLKGNGKSISRVRRILDYDGTYFCDKDLYDNRELMISFFKRNLDNPNAQNLYSENIINSGQSNVDEAIRLLKLSIDSGNVDALWNLGSIQYKKDNKKDALKLWKLSTEKGSPYGQYKMACMYENERGEVEKNLYEAFRLCKLSAEQDYVDAQYKLGYMYYNGKGIDIKNHGEAAKWFKLAADQNHYSALNSLAYMYSFGYGVEKNQLEAIKYYNIAYKQHRHYNELQPAREKSMAHGYLEQVLKDYTLELAEIVPKSSLKISTIENETRYHSNLLTNLKDKMDYLSLIPEMVTKIEILEKENKLMKENYSQVGVISTLQTRFDALEKDNKELQNKLEKHEQQTDLIENLESKNAENLLRINHLQRKVDRMANKMGESMFDKLKMYLASFDCFRNS